uniref:Putative nucleic-acid-binding protein from transposon x-element n=1 Tax=Lutzomyia longipalpis TaxID=7200 RepID=A0A1B0CCC0_LUTLO
MDDAASAVKSQDISSGKRPRDDPGPSRKTNLKQPKIVNWLAVPTRNSFDPLSSGDTENDMETDDVNENNASPDTAVKKEPTPPPIFVHGVETMTPLVALLEAIAKDSYSMKALRDNTVKVQSKNSDAYRKIHKALKDKGTDMHSYQLKSDKGFRVVVRGLHHSTKHEDIKGAFSTLGHNVKHVHNVKHRGSNQPLPLFFVEFAGNENNKKVYDVTRLLHCVVQVEPPRPKKDIVQCTRCQRFGHTKSFCHRAPRCVKCLGGHSTSECTRKTRDEGVRCVNCEGYHPANYRGCDAARRLNPRRNVDLRQRIRNERNLHRELSTNVNNTQRRPDLLYSDVVGASGGNDEARLNPVGNTSNVPHVPQSAQNSEMDEFLLRLIQQDFHLAQQELLPDRQGFSEVLK